jgi:hypothetical protein
VLRGGSRIRTLEGISRRIYSPRVHTCSATGWANKHHDGPTFGDESGSRLPSNKRSDDAPVVYLVPATEESR